MGKDIMEENAKIAAFAIRGKMYTDKHRKIIVWLISFFFFTFKLNNP